MVINQLSKTHGEPVPVSTRAVGRGDDHSIWAIATAALLIGAYCASSSAVAASEDPKIEQIESAQIPDYHGLDSYSMEQLLARFHVPGVSVAVIVNYHVVWAKGWGVADVKTGTPVTPATLFQAASISKPVAAMASLKAIQDGKFGLDEDINQVLKSWRLPPDGYTTQQAVTPRLLMSHTSGMDDGFGFPGYAPNAPMPTILQILDGASPANTGPVRLGRAPLSGYKYSGGGVIVEQLALTDTLRMPFGEIMRQEVLGPLGMTDSTYDQPLDAALQSRAAHAHDEFGRPMDAPWHVYPEQAAAGLWTTPSDLAKFVVEVQLSLLGRSNRILSRDMTEKMVSPVGVGPFGDGFEVHQQGEGWYFSHTGSNWGYQCALISHRVKGYGAVVMTNGDNGGDLAQEIIARIARAYHWDSLDKGLLR